MISNYLKKIGEIVRLMWRGYGFYRVQIILLVISGLVGGFLEGVGVNAAIPLFSFLTGGLGRGDDQISKMIVGFFDFLGVPFSLRYLLAFIFVVFALRAIVLLFNNIVKIKITTDYSEHVRNRLFTKVIRADWPHLLKQKLGHLDTLLMTNVHYSESLLHSLSGTIMLLTGLAMYLVVAINISRPITIFTLALGALLFIFFRPILNRTRRLSSAVETLNRDIAHFVNEHVVGMKTVKATLSDKPVIERGQGLFRRVKELRFKLFFLSILPESLVQPIGLMFVLILFAFSYKMPNFNVAAFVAVVYLIDKMFIYLQQLQNQFQRITEYVPYLRTVMNYEDDALLNTETDEGKSPFNFEKTLQFKDVKFSYDGGKEVLRGLNFSVTRGESIGLVGPSGVGKTTVVDLVLRLFKPTEGEILVDSKNISEIKLSDWRNHIGYISQDIFLLNDTISNNIRFYDRGLSESAIAEAAKLAEISDFVKAQPKGMDTMVGERGTMLSVGQRQRIAIARVLARDPKILILDEATSALDNETEKEIQKVIEKLKGRVTTIMIAHRLSTVMQADKLLVLDDGKVKEEGSPEDLLKDDSSYFAKLYRVALS